MMAYCVHSGDSLGCYLVWGVSFLVFQSVAHLSSTLQISESYLAELTRSFLLALSLYFAVKCVKIKD